MAPMGFLTLAAGSAALLLGCERLLVRMRPRPDDSDPVLLLLLFTLFQSALMLAAGLCGLLKPLPLGILAGVGLAVYLASGSKPDWRRWLPAPEAKPARAAAWILGLHFAGLALKGLFLSPYWGDALIYHLPKVAVWIQEGRFVWPVGPEPRQWFPAGFELVELWWIVFPRHDALIELAGFQMFLLAACSVRVLARIHGARPDLALLVFSFLPIVILHVTATANDLAAAALTLSAFALLAARVPRTLVCLPLLLGAGVKPTALFALGGILLYGLRAGPPDLKLPRIFSIPLIAMAFVLGGFWYARNHVVHGHPLFPVYTTGAQANAMQFGPLENLEKLHSTLDEFPRRMLDRRPFTGLAASATAWGWFVLPFGLPLLALSLRSDPGMRRLLVAFLASALPILALSPLSDFNLRFVLWFPALFAIAAGQHPSRWVWFGAALAALLNFVATVVPIDSRLPAHWERPRNIPAHAPIACPAIEDVPSYRLYNADFSRRVTYPRDLSDLRASGVRYLQSWGGWNGDEEVRRWKRVEGNLYEVP